MEKDRWKAMFHPSNRKMRSNILLALLFGIMFLVAGKGFSQTEEKKVPLSEAEASICRETEQRMSEILSGVEGAGMVDVMLTYRQMEEKTIAQNESREESGETLRTEQTVVLLENADGDVSPFILTERGPVVEGVVITAQGADQPSVAAALHQAAQALLDVPAHKVAILKMK